MKDNKYTYEEMEIARSTDLPNLAEAFGHEVQIRGRWHFIKDAQHIVIKNRTRYYDNYKQQWGDAITFLQDYADMGFHEAVDFLLNYNGYVRDAPTQKPEVRLPKKEEKTPVPFTLPEANEDNGRVFSYLRKRGIAYQVIDAFVKSGLLYEDKKYHNCVFVGRNADGKEVFAYKRGTYDKDGAEPKRAQWAMQRGGSPVSYERCERQRNSATIANCGTGFKGDVEGSNKDIAFRLPCNPELDMLRVYESPIDLMSDMTLRRYITSNCVALCCLHDGALESYLNDHPHIKSIDLCLDADQWGRQAAKRMKEKFTERGYEVRDFTPPRGKDWNEYLCLKKQKTRERSDAR